MSIVTISRGSYNQARLIAEKLAVTLNHRCVSRDELIDGLTEFHLPELKMVRNLKDEFTVLDRFPHGKKRFISSMKLAILENLSRGNVVYHGLIAQHFLGDIKHVLRVRIVTDIEKRIAAETERASISKEQAKSLLQHDDEERRKWGMFLYNVDVNEPQGYDIVINVDRMSQDEAVEIIAAATQFESFRETGESRALVSDLALVAKLETKLFDFPNASVIVQNGKAKISLKVPKDHEGVIRGRIEEKIEPILSGSSYALLLEPLQ